MAIRLTPQGIETTETIEASQVLQTVEALTGGGTAGVAYDINVSGSSEITGSFAVYNFGDTTKKIVLQSVTSNTTAAEYNAVLIDSTGELYTGTATKGEKGAQGAQGFTGAQGIQGFTGAQGFEGDKGTQGALGPANDPGDKGAQGAQGIQGIQGIQGFQGEKGAQGIQGLQGLQGIQGFQGEQGLQGAQGFTGDKGQKGQKGQLGAQGVQGIQGLQGVIGEDPISQNFTVTVSNPGSQEWVVQLLLVWQVLKDKKEK